MRECSGESSKRPPTERATNFELTEPFPFPLPNPGACYRRLQNVVVVLERSSSTRHYEAVCRTCECLGVQNVWCLEHPPPQQLEKCETEQVRPAIGSLRDHSSFFWAHLAVERGG